MSVLEMLVASIGALGAMIVTCVLSMYIVVGAAMIIESIIYRVMKFFKKGGVK